MDGGTVDPSPNMAPHNRKLGFGKIILHATEL